MSCHSLIVPCRRTIAFHHSDGKCPKKCWFFSFDNKALCCRSLLYIIILGSSTSIQIEGTRPASPLLDPVFASKEFLASSAVAFSFSPAFWTVLIASSISSPALKASAFACLSRYSLLTKKIPGDKFYPTWWWGSCGSSNPGPSSPSDWQSLETGQNL